MKTAFYLFQYNYRDIAISALESLIAISTNTSQVVIAYRCLIRLRMTYISEACDTRYYTNLF